MLSGHLDPRTLGIVTDIVAVCLTALAVLLWRSHQMYPGFERWTLGRLIGVLTILFSIQIGIWPFAIVFAGACALGNGILSLDACRQFLGLKPVLPLVYAGAGLLMGQVAIVEALHYSSQATYVEVTFALALLSGWTGFTLLSDLESSKGHGRKIAGVVFVVRGAIYALRTFYFLTHPRGTLFDDSLINVAFLAFNVIFEIVVNFSFFFMHYERLIKDHAEQVRNTTVANKALTELKVHLEERVRQRTAELVRSQKLESVARLAGGVAHDFNNILMVINGYSALLLGQLQPGDPMYDPIDQIGIAGERATGLTRQLLAFSRQQKDDPQTISFHTLLLGMTEMLRRLIGEDIEIILQPGIGTDEVRADKGQIEQVVMNLAINARDAMPGGGKLILETSVESVDPDFAAECLGVPPGTYVTLSVTDTGVGMTPAVQAHIFEPFFTTKKEGTGLGLSTTYGIVKQSGGCINVQSTPGFGTTFKVFLPAAENAAQESEATKVDDSPTKGNETILLVEDQQEVRRLMREILGEHGYHTLEAAGGDDAISIAKRYPAPIHLIITDMVLPQMNGPEIVHRIRQIKPGVGVLMISGYTADHLDGQLDENTPYLQKPFTSDELLRQVREILDLSRENASARAE